MELIMKERKLSLKDSFTIKDGEGNDKYKVTAEFLNSGKLHIQDMNGNEVASVQKKIISFKPKFYFYVNGTRVGEIIKDSALIGSKYHIKGLYNWKVDGNITDHKYSILEGRKKIVTVKKKRLALAGTYIFDIEDESNEVPALAAVLAIDYCTSKL